MEEENKKDRALHRCALLDSLRGFTVINMVLYHAVWDLTRIFGVNIPFYTKLSDFIWQQAICCTFIVLSGFCAALGKHTLRRGAVVFGLGAVISLVTALFMPEELIIFGVLTLIGSSMLLVEAAKPLLKKIPAWAGLTASFSLFALTRRADNGSLGLFFKALISLPKSLYRNYFTAFFGFPQPGFSSSDYFPLIPWVFLFLTGFFLFRLSGKYVLSVKWQGIPPLNFIGRHALFIYLIHQPGVYGLIWLTLHLLPR